MASIKEQINPSCSTLYASASRELIPTHGIFKLSWNASTVPTPILIPVKDPGPLSQTSKSILL